MGIAGSFFDPQPCNFGKLDIFLRCSNDISTIFEIPYGDRLAKNGNGQYVQVIPRFTNKERTCCFKRILNKPLSYEYCPTIFQKLNYLKYHEDFTQMKSPFDMINL